jgi:hypothetical protein
MIPMVRKETANERESVSNAHEIPKRKKSNVPKAGPTTIARLPVTWFNPLARARYGSSTKWPISAILAGCYT